MSVKSSTGWEHFSCLDASIMNFLYIPDGHQTVIEDNPSPLSVTPSKQIFNLLKVNLKLSTILSRMAQVQSNHPLVTLAS
jgi:hypothetical protein